MSFEAIICGVLVYIVKMTCGAGCMACTAVKEGDTARGKRKEGIESERISHSFWSMRSETESEEKDDAYISCGADA